LGFTEKTDKNADRGEESNLVHTLADMDEPLRILKLLLPPSEASDLHNLEDLEQVRRAADFLTHAVDGNDAVPDGAETHGLGGLMQT
jgi:hypothetical protein